MSIDFNKYPLKSKVRHHISAFNYLPLSELKNVPETYPKIIYDIQWNNYFSNGKQPDIIDIGCGKGHFLLNMAKLNPERNLLGIEIREPLVEWINDVAVKEKINNCKALRYTVVNGLDFIPDDSIEKIFYLFPDPWPKKRHIKRRAFNIDFLENCYRILKPNGKLLLSTDLDYIDEYHKEVLEQFEKFSYNSISENEWNYPSTNKESFCIRKNIDIYRIICNK